jgi:hypothetical protein
MSPLQLQTRESQLRPYAPMRRQKKPSNSNIIYTPYPNSGQDNDHCSLLASSLEKSTLHSSVTILNPLCKSQIN